MFLAISKPIVLTTSTDASLECCSTPPLWHIDAVGGVHPITLPGHSASHSGRLFLPLSSRLRGGPRFGASSLYSSLDEKSGLKSSRGFASAPPNAKLCHNAGRG